MLTSRWFVATVVLLLAGAIGYNVWFFTRDDGAGPPTPAGAAGEGPPAESAAGAGSDGPDGELVSDLAAGRIPLRTEEEMAAVEAWRAGRPAWGRDPLSRPGADGEGETGVVREEPSPPPWRVTAIVRGEDRRTAVIDGRAYTEGDGIDGGRIEEIRAREVLIRWRGRLVRVRLREP